MNDIACFPVGVTGFEPATTRPPDAYSNRAELHPELRVQKYGLFLNGQNVCRVFLSFEEKYILSSPEEGGHKDGLIVLSR